jgi:hypothetical protein
MKWISVNDRLPEGGEYVLAHHNRGTWHDDIDQKNVSCVVVKLIKGISRKERQQMIDGKIDDPIIDAGWCLSEGYTKSNRSRLYYSQDEDGNNKRPYCWSSFGPDNFFGQDITHWMPLPKPPKR